MQPKFRQLVWRELPPFVRRAYVGWSRRLFHLELTLGHLYLSWTRSPTWNFVGFFGTLGIVLTILLFLAPWADQPRSATTRRIQQGRPAWELDSRLLAIRSAKPPAYLVEQQSGDYVRQSVTTWRDDPPPRRRPLRHNPDDQPLTPLIMEEPGMPVAVRAPSPPNLGWDVVVVTPTRRPVREAVIAETSWTGRSGAVSVRDIHFERDTLAGNDNWQTHDPARIARMRRDSADVEHEHTTVSAAEWNQQSGDPWQPAALPVSAASAADLQLELAWDRTAGGRRGNGQLQLRNLGLETISRLDVFADRLPDIDADSLLHQRSQSVDELAPGLKAAVALPATIGRRSSGSQWVSVLVTTFVGSVTQVSGAVAERPRPAAHTLERRVPAREPDRPHLTMTVARAGKMPLDKMFSVPLRVVNDGNVALHDVVVIADVPASLDHQYGRTVHYRLGTLEPGAQKRATLLLTPLEAGSSTVPLRVSDGRQRAEDSGTASLYISAEELAALKESPAEPRRRTSRDLLEHARPEVPAAAPPVRRAPAGSEQTADDFGVPPT